MSTSTSSGPSLAPIATGARLGAWVVVLGVMAQAVLAGQGWFGGQQALFGLHGGIGHGVLLVAAVLALACWVLPGARVAAVLATLNVVALLGQTGLGYAGRRGGVGLASSLHVPLGVAILGAAVAVAVLLTVRDRAADA
ncbi:MAG: hypothetical protein JJT89_09410 [Nitriliruptoraceae bacterium]|nr:hypothetical protein [Nitriliruptoraceae bacterium]